MTRIYFNPRRYVMEVYNMGGRAVLPLLDQKVTVAELAPVNEALRRHE